MMQRSIALASIALALVARASAEETSSPAVRFNRDVRPILSDKCYHCHGPDSATREAGLRLDLEEAVFRKRSEPLVDPGNPGGSELFLRVSTTDADLRMPPADSGRSLTPAQIKVLKDWIAQGAKWEGHWSFQPVESALPESDSAGDWSQNGIDVFVANELSRRGLRRSPEASEETQIRRVTLDLTGVPPTIDEIDDYLADRSPERYERLVDRLLASPRYGEHMAVAWLDAARYADTSGYQTDGIRHMWRWRDWVIGAFNSDMPFDQFTVEQLAGDLLTNPTLDQQIATGFNRNHRANSEGGSIAEEFLVENVVDRVDTTGTVWLGLTIGCARCHDHKYDPISQKEFYQLFAYFHNIPESGKAIKLGNSPPYIKAPTSEQQAHLIRLDSDLAAAHERWSGLSAERLAAQRAWESQALLSTRPIESDWTISRGLTVHLPLGHDLSGAFPASVTPKLSVGEPEFVCQERRSLRLDGKSFVDAGDVGAFGFLDAFSIAAWIKPEGNLTGGIVSHMSDDSDSDGWAFHLQDGKLQVNLVKRWLDDALRVEAATPLAPGRWQHVAMTYDGSRVPDGIQIYVDGEPCETVIRLNELNQTFKNAEPLRIGSTGTSQRLTGELADARVYDVALSRDELQIVSVEAPLGKLLALPESQRTAAQAAKVREYFLTHTAPADLQAEYQRLKAAETDRQRYFDAIPTSMVMQEMNAGRPTFVLARGSYEHPTAPVAPGIPAALGKTPSTGGDRLTLARWLVDPENPLTARVAVNREWQKFFGIGLVKTAEDFGTQGERPSHPELLDWLADEFVRSGWRMKAIQRQIVTSATYRQASNVSPDLLEADPENRLLARGPRFRMTAEMIRDRALAVSGLLQDRFGGESVKPYQPAGLWSKIASDAVYDQSQGADLYRRSLYSFVKRTVANPTTTLFDATTREYCSVRRSRTNTPLQALTLMNDVTFVEAARVLAERALLERSARPNSDIVCTMFRHALGRNADTSELVLLTSSLARHRSHFRETPADAQAFISMGESKPSASIDPVELAACTALANSILNLDEFVNRE